MTEQTSARAIRLLALREKLAEQEHIKWADWQRYFHGKCLRREDGALVVPAGYVAALERLIATPYDELPREQQRADRDEVDRYWPLIMAELAKQEGER